MSQKFVKKAFLMRDRSSEPRQGRQRVAQGVSPGCQSVRRNMCPTQGLHPGLLTAAPLGLKTLTDLVTG